MCIYFDVYVSTYRHWVTWEYKNCVTQSIIHWYFLFINTPPFIYIYIYIELKKEDIDYSVGSFLDLRIKIVPEKFNSRLYDKRVDFLFLIVRMQHLTSHVPSKMFYSVTGTGILWRTCTTSKYETFYKTFENLISKTTKQGGDINVLTKRLFKIHARYFQTFRKFYNTSKEFADSLIK